MDYTNIIDKKNDTPVYRQIIEKITESVQKSELKVGDKLPTERELADLLFISRGTISKAYEELERDSIITAVQGKGCFVSAMQDTYTVSRKEKAVTVINDTILTLEQLDFSIREIRIFFELLLMQHEQNAKKIDVAAVDCNPEALSIFENQLKYLSHVHLYKFLLSDCLMENDIEKRLEEFDLILTTSTHYEEVVKAAPKLREFVIQAAVSPSQETVIALAKLPGTVSIGVITRSPRFFEIIQDRLHGFDVDLKKVSHEMEREDADYYGFLHDKNVLIIPPDFAFEKTKSFVDAIAAFTRQGGKVIRFNYQIDRGTLITIEERIQSIVDRRNDG